MRVPAQGGAREPLKTGYGWTESTLLRQSIMSLPLVTLTIPGSGGRAGSLPLPVCCARLQWVFLHRRPPLGLPSCPLQEHREVGCQPSVYFRQAPTSHPLHPTSSLPVSPAVRVLFSVPSSYNAGGSEGWWNFSRVTQHREYGNAVTNANLCPHLQMPPNPSGTTPAPSSSFRSLTLKSHSLTPPQTFTAPFRKITQL